MQMLSEWVLVWYFIVLSLLEATLREFYHHSLLNLCCHASKLNLWTILFRFLLFWTAPAEKAWCALQPDQPTSASIWSRMRHSMQTSKFQVPDAGLHPFELPLWKCTTHRSPSKPTAKTPTAICWSVLRTQRPWPANLPPSVLVSGFWYDLPNACPQSLWRWVQVRSALCMLATRYCFGPRNVIRTRWDLRTYSAYACQGCHTQAGGWLLLTARTKESPKLYSAIF